MCTQRDSTTVVCVRTKIITFTITDHLVILKVYCSKVDTGVRGANLFTVGQPGAAVGSFISKST